MHSLLINPRVSSMLGALSSTWLLSWISNRNNAQKNMYLLMWLTEVHTQCQNKLSESSFKWSIYYITLPILAECGTPKLTSTLWLGANCQHHLINSGMMALFSITCLHCGYGKQSSTSSQPIHLGRIPVSQFALWKADCDSTEGSLAPFSLWCSRLQQKCCWQQ